MAGHFSRKEPPEFKWELQQTSRLLRRERIFPELPGSSARDKMLLHHPGHLHLSPGKAEEGRAVTRHPQGLWCPSSRLSICPASRGLTVGLNNILVAKPPHMSHCYRSITKDCDSLKFKTFLRRTDTFNVELFKNRAHLSIRSNLLLVLPYGFLHISN